MTRQEIETYLLHMKAEPGSFVLDEQADRLEKEIRMEVLRARIEENEEFGSHLHLLDETCTTCSRIAVLRAELSKLEVPGE